MKVGGEQRGSQNPPVFHSPLLFGTDLVLLGYIISV